MKTPEYYKAPLRSRHDIVAWLLDRAKSNPRPSYGLFCYNVKLGRLDTSFARVLAVGRDCGELACESPRYLAELESLWNEKVETAFEVGTEDAQNSVMDTDGYRMLWDGAGPIADWCFAGRSAGWLVLTKFDGVDFEQAAWASCMSQSDWAVDFFAEQSFRYLRNLYRFLVQCDHDFANPEREVEYQAASYFLLNCVDGIATDAEIAERERKKLFEAAESSYWAARDVITT